MVVHVHAIKDVTDRNLAFSYKSFMGP